MQKIMLALMLVSLMSCSKEKAETPHPGPSENIPEMNASQNFQQDLVGTAYGNIAKMSKALESDNLAEAKKLANETRYLLLGYADSVERNNLPDLRERARNAVYHFDRVLFYMDNGNLKKARDLVVQCKYELDALREATGVERLD